MAKNPDKQDKLRQEILELLPDVDSKITAEGINKLPYLRACIKESMRLQPVVAGTQRGTAQNIVLDGYQIPKGVRFFFNGLVSVYEFHLLNLYILDRCCITWSYACYGGKVFRKEFRIHTREMVTK